MAAGIDARGEARAPFLPRAGAVLGGALIRAGPHALRRAGAIAPPVAAHAGGVGSGRLESRTGMGRASQALSRPYPRRASGCGTAALGSLFPPRNHDWMPKYTVMNEDSVKKKNHQTQPKHSQTI